MSSDSPKNLNPTILCSLQDVSFSYQGASILSKVNIEIKRGKVTAIMGLSGSGKTTILKLIGGLISADSGMIHVLDQNIKSASIQQLHRIRKKMGMLFQFGALFSDLTVFDNVAFPLKENTNLSKELIYKLVMMKLQAVGLNGAKDLLPSQLSGGMQRRAALARSIALDPLLMMYDEPFSGLDPISLKIISDLIRSLNDALGSGSVMVTHDIKDSMHNIDHVYFLLNREIVFSGTPDEFLSSNEPHIKQFASAQKKGPIQFFYPNENYQNDLLTSKST